MRRSKAAGLAVAGIVFVLSCQNPVNDGPDVPTVPEWYPSTISGYEPYSISLSTGAPVPLEPGLDQTSFTEEEIIGYTAEFIDQRQELIGADSKALRLVSIQKRDETDSLRAEYWNLTYEQIDGYKFEMLWYYGTVSLVIVGGKVNSLSSWVIPVVPVPDEPIVSNEAIRDSLIGEQLTYYDYDGNLLTHEVTEDEPIVFKDLLVFPTLIGSTLEVRLCREVEVGGGKWYLFYDAMTGEKIYVHLAFWA